MPTIGLLGGTFDPIHFGHLNMAQALAVALKLDEVRFIPAAVPPHKPAPLASAQHRAAMVKLAISGNPMFSLDDRELLKTGPSYTLDTLISLRQELAKNTRLILFMGSDAFSQFNTWHGWQQIIQLCHIAIVQRPLDAACPALNGELERFLQQHLTTNVDDLSHQAIGCIIMQAIAPMAISSSAIRQLIRHQYAVRQLMPDSVLDYIQSNKLYQHGL